MKKILALSGVAMLFAASFVTAEEAQLINFGELGAGDDGQHAETIFDYSTYAGSTYTQEERDMMNTSYAINNWVVTLNNSARNVVADRLTVARETYSNDLGSTVMGVRILFPTNGSNNANAVVRPPYPVLGLHPDVLTGVEEEGTENRNYFDENPYIGTGLINNVGIIKMVEMNIRGLNFPHSVSILLERIGGKIEEIPMGSLAFDGWKTLTWTNPSYAFEVRQRDLRRMPVYPYTIPYIKLNGIKFYRNGQNMGGDFIAYIKDIVVVFDKAVRDDVPQDIDDEAVWQILRSREEARMRLELRNLGERLVYEYTQAKLMDTSRPTTFPASGTIPVNDRRPTTVDAE